MRVTPRQEVEVNNALYDTITMANEDKELNAMMLSK